MQVPGFNMELAVFTQETYYPLDNLRQTDNTTWFENATVLIFDE